MNKLKKYPIDILIISWAICAAAIVALNLLNYFILNF